MHRFLSAYAQAHSLQGHTVPRYAVCRCTDHAQLLVRCAVFKTMGAAAAVVVAAAAAVAAAPLTRPLASLG